MTKTIPCFIYLRDGSRVAAAYQVKSKQFAYVINGRTVYVSQDAVCGVEAI